MMGPMRPAPGRGMNITISIDLGDFLGGPCPPPDCKPEECDDDKLTYFNEANRPKRSGFREAAGNVAGKFGQSPKKPPANELSSFSREDDDKDEKEEEEEEEK